MTPCDIIPLWFEEGALKNDRDTIVVKDKDDINEIVNVVKSLKLSDRKTLDVRGKITVYYDSPETQIWVYWSDFAVAVGLNGMVYEMSKQFADMINRILKKHSRDVFLVTIGTESISPQHLQKQVGVLEKMVGKPENKNSIA